MIDRDVQEYLPANMRVTGIGGNVPAGYRLLPQERELRESAGKDGFVQDAAVDTKTSLAALTRYADMNERRELGSRKGDLND
jgi:hypothetical protein